jgi:TolA-binding protein
MNMNMNKMNKRRANGRWLGCLLALAALGVVPTFAGVQGTIITKDGREIPGELRYRGTVKQYEITDKGAMKSIPLDKVQEVRVTPPPQLAEAIGKVKAKRAAEAIPALVKIMDDYQMMGLDVTAAAWLARAYLNSNQPKQAAEVVQKMMRENPQAAQSDDFVNVCADALSAAEKDAELSAMLGEIIKHGSRSAAAWAQIKRGDIEVKKGNFKDALIDGYLRTVVLYGDIKQAQPEAIFDAAQCFDHLGQGPYAEKMRKRLIEDYPQSSFIEKLKSGG